MPSRIVEDLGGPDAVTAMQRGMIDGYTKAMVAADVEFAPLARGETPGGSERRFRPEREVPLLLLIAV